MRITFSSLSAFCQLKINDYSLPKAKDIAISKLHIPIIIDGRYCGPHFAFQTKELALYNAMGEC